MIIISKTPEKLSLVTVVIAFTTYDQTLMKIWKRNCKILFLLLLLQIGYIFKTFMKASNVMQISI